ncbi:MAG TPA: hypothetical protein VIW67_21660, partial [Terriglobales bacterium]
MKPHRRHDVYFSGHNLPYGIAAIFFTMANRPQMSPLKLQWTRKSSYSRRSAVIGSTNKALRAGIKQAK